MYHVDAGPPNHARPFRFPPRCRGAQVRVLSPLPQCRPGEKAPTNCSLFDTKEINAGRPNVAPAGAEVFAFGLENYEVHGCLTRRGRHQCSVLDCVQMSDLAGTAAPASLAAFANGRCVLEDGDPEWMPIVQVPAKETTYICKFATMPGDPNVKGHIVGFNSTITPRVHHFDFYTCDRGVPPGVSKASWAGGRVGWEREREERSRCHQRSNRDLQAVQGGSTGQINARQMCQGSC